MENESIKTNLGLLEVRLGAARRNAWILGIVLFLALASLFFVGLIRPISQREAVLITAVLSAFALGFVTSLARAESLKAVRDLTQALLARE